MGKERNPRRRFAGFTKFWPFMSVTKYSLVERERMEKSAKRFREGIRRDMRNRMRIFATEKFQKIYRRRYK